MVTVVRTKLEEENYTLVVDRRSSRTCEMLAVSTAVSVHVARAVERERQRSEATKQQKHGRTSGHSERVRELTSGVSGSLRADPSVASQL